MAVPKLPPFEEALFIPERIRALPRWVYWEARWDNARSRWDKIPFVVSTGKGKDWQKPESGASYEDAVAAALKLNFAGVGFVLFPEDRVVGIDLDRVRDPTTGKVEEWAQAIINLKETYVEISPSGTGIRIFAEGDLGGEQAVVNALTQVEMYTAKKYLTVTGRHVTGTPVDVLPAPATILALTARARAAGAPRKSATITPMVAGDPGRVLAVEPKLRAPLVGKIIGAIKNNIDKRGDWIAVMHGLDGALDGDEEAGFPIWMGFCGRWETGPSDPVEDKRVWDKRGHDGAAGIGTLLKILEAQGTPEATAVREEVSRATLAAAFKPIPGSEEAPKVENVNVGPIADWESTKRGKARPIQPTILPGLDRGLLTVIGGPSGVLKSTFLMHAAVAIVCERADILGLAKLDFCGDVLVFANEDPEAITDKRLDAIQSKWGISGFKHKLFILEGQIFEKVGGAEGKFQWRKDAEARITQVIQQTRAAGGGLALIAIDTLSATSVDNRETNAEMQAIANLASELVRKIGAAGLFVHHLRKAGTGDKQAAEVEPGLDALRGGGAFGNSVRNVLFMAKPNAAEQKRGLGLEMVKLRIVKRSYGPEGEPQWFQREAVGVPVTDARDGSLGVENYLVLVPATTNVAAARMNILRGALNALKVEAAAGRTVRRMTRSRGGTDEAQEVLGMGVKEANEVLDELVGLGAVKVVEKKSSSKNPIWVVEVVKGWGEDQSEVGEE